ncbi:MAG: HPr(Ser) kinase/phosphatase [Clostridiales bacterium]|jgi:HPr kinase/phosphorylase|nr:HPr(Ser) kinase/phosphatase [Clostridiales bacterium]
MEHNSERNLWEQEAVDPGINQADVKLREFCEKMDLEALVSSRKRKLHFSTYQVNRPGLQLAGFFEHFGPERVQVLGEQEISYLKHMGPERRVLICENISKFDFPCLVVTTGLEPPQELLDAAKKFERVILRSRQKTTFLVNRLSYYLNEILAPAITMHGVLVEMFGVGVLIVGKSSIGKSETALELIQRGHRLVADDAVTIKKIGQRLVGSAPSVIRYFMEVRGIGIIDVRSMYGSGAVIDAKGIDLVVKLETWDDSVTYDRMGDKKSFFTVMAVRLPLNNIPVKPGRNLAVILEVAARNYRLNSMGYNAVDELYNRMAANSEPPADND